MKLGLVDYNSPLRCNYQVDSQEVGMDTFRKQLRIMPSFSNGNYQLGKAGISKIIISIHMPNVAKHSYYKKNLFKSLNLLNGGYLSGMSKCPELVTIDRLLLKARKLLCP